MLYEDHLLANYGSGLLAYWPFGEASGTLNDVSPNAFPAVAQLGLTFAQGGIPNSSKTAIRFTGTSNGASYAQLESSPGSRMRLGGGTGGPFTVACWFKRLGTGVTAITGTGGITIEPLIMKGLSESETSGLNANYCLGLEAMGSDFFLSCDAEKKDTSEANRPTGRNLRQIDFTADNATDTLRTRTDTGLATTFQHEFAAGDRVRFAGTTIPSGLTAAIWYYVVNPVPSSGTFQLATTQGGTPVNFTSNGTALWLNHAKASSLISSTDTDWHMAAMRWDGANHLQTFLDGLLAEDEKVTMYPPEDTSQQICTIACGATSAAVKTSGGGFNGLIGHVAFWNAALTSGNILDLFQVGLLRSSTQSGRASVLATASGSISGRAACVNVQSRTLAGRVMVTASASTVLVSSENRGKCAVVIPPRMISASGIDVKQIGTVVT